MGNPYRAPESSLKNSLRRTFSTPLIAPLTILMVVFIYAGYTYYFFTSEQTGIFAYLKSISFEIFIACQTGIILLTFFIKKQLDNFFNQHPIIKDKMSLEVLKPVVRTNMYSALLQLFFICVSALTAVMSILNYGGMISIVVIVLAIFTGRITKWARKSEENLKQIECPDEALEKELNDILHCWLHKPLPNF